MISAKKVVIAGAGTAGLTFAIAVQQKALENGLEPPSVILLERDPSPEAKDRQNYSLSLHADKRGVLALEEIGVLDSIKFLAANQKGMFMGTHDAHKWIFNIAYDAKPEDKGMRVQRVGLWKTLLEKALSFESVSVQWSSTASNVFLLDPADGSVVDHKDPKEMNRLKDVPCKMRVELSDGSTIDDADVVIVADGSRSRLREVLLGDTEKLNFLNTAGIIGESKFDLETETVPAEINRRHGMLMGKGCSVYVSHESPETVIWSIAFPASSPRHATDVLHDNIEESIGSALCREALEVGKDIPEPFATLVRHSLTDKMRLLSFFDKYPHRSSMDGRVIYIGDSTHPVSPYAGSGANMAIVDGLHLAKFLCSPSFKTLSSAASAFDDEMVKRTSQRVTQQRRVIKIAIKQTTPLSLFLRSTAFSSVGFVVNHFVAIKRITIASVVAATAAGLYFASQRLFPNWSIQSLTQ